MTTREQSNLKLEKAKRLYDYFYEKNNFYTQKSRRARSDDMIYKHFKRADMYFKLWRRTDKLKTLIREMDNPDLTREVDRIMIMGEYRARLSRKAKGKENYIARHRCSKWFYSDSFGADYGTFVCEKCGGIFYHSPSTLKRAGKIVYNCCCGYCTNTIIQRDWGETIYI